MLSNVALASRLYFSYGQFMIYDESITSPACLWTTGHTAQGFARRPSAACFGTLLEFGHANLTCELKSCDNFELYERVITIPFLVVSGSVSVEGPEENNVDRNMKIPQGHYRLTVAQAVIDEQEELIDLFFEKRDEPLAKSAVIVADNQLNIPNVFLECAEIA